MFTQQGTGDKGQGTETGPHKVLSSHNCNKQAYMQDDADDNEELHLMMILDEVERFACRMIPDEVDRDWAQEDARECKHGGKESI